MAFGFKAISVTEASAAHEAAIEKLVEIQTLLMQVAPEIKREIDRKSDELIDTGAVEGDLDLAEARGLSEAVVTAQSRLTAATTLKTNCEGWLRRLGIETAELPPANEAARLDLEGLRGLALKANEIQRAARYLRERQQSVRRNTARLESVRTAICDRAELRRLAHFGPMHLTETDLRLIFELEQLNEEILPDRRELLEEAQTVYDSLLRATPPGSIAQAFANALHDANADIAAAPAEHEAAVERFKEGLPTALAQAKRDVTATERDLDRAHEVERLLATAMASTVGSLQVPEPAEPKAPGGSARGGGSLWAMLFGGTRREPTGNSSSLKRSGPGDPF